MSQQYIADTTESIILNGYKQTEIGIIPIDWNVVNIGSLCSIFGRIGFRGYTKADIVSEDQGALSISPSNIVDGKVSWEKGTYISWRKYHESPEIKIYEEDILLVKTGSTYGKVGLVKKLKQEATLNPQVVVLKNRKCPSSLLAYLMQFELVQKQIGETIVGGAIPTLSQKEVANYLVPISPNHQEQILIATALSDVDALICKLEKLIAKKQAIKTATMQQLLTGKTRLPQFSLREDGSKKGFKQSELGEIPEDWEVYSFKQNFIIYAGGDVPKNSLSKIKTDKYPYPIFANAIQEKGLYGYTGCIRSKPDSVTITARGYLGHAEYRSEYFFPIVRLLVMEPIGALDSKFTTYVINELVEFPSESTGVPQLTAPQVGRFSIAAPVDKNEQTVIATILSDTDSEIQALEKRLNKTHHIKQGMMQELLTGKTRLVQPEA